jgi:hypothetical protein
VVTAPPRVGPAPTRADLAKLSADDMENEMFEMTREELLALMDPSSDDD